MHRTRPHGHGQDLLAGSWSGTESPVSAHQLCKYVCQWPLTLRVSLTFKYLAPWNPPSLSLGYLLVCVCVCVGWPNKPINVPQICMSSSPSHCIDTLGKALAWKIERMPHAFHMPCRKFDLNWNSLVLKSGNNNRWQRGEGSGEVSRAGRSDTTLC